MKDFGSITIYNVMFKFISKVRVYRLCPIIDSLIGPFHSNFIPNRSTTDNTFVAQEIVHHRHKKKGRSDYFLIPRLVRLNFVTRNFSRNQPIDRLCVHIRQHQKQNDDDKMIYKMKT